MSRPADWWVLDLGRDPTPGEPFAVRTLARGVQRVADDARRAERDVRSLAGDGAVTAWIGLAGDVFRGALNDFPAQLAKLSDSYGLCAGALTTFAGELDSAQDQADRALEQGRAARAEIAALQAQLSSARSSAAAASRTASDLSRPPSPGAEPPDPDQVRAATRNAQAANNRVSSLTSSLGSAQARLEAAKRMARDAEDLRNDAGDRAKRRLHDASDAGIAPKSRWERFKDGLARAWDITIKIATVVAIAVAVLALFVGGPLVWGLLAAASLLLLADSLMKYANGDGSLWEVGLNLLGIVPGGRLLTALGRMTGLTRIGAQTVALTSRGAAAGRAALGRMTSAVRDGLAPLTQRLAGDAGHLRLPFRQSARHLDEARLLREFPEFADGGLPSAKALKFQDGTGLYPGQDDWIDVVGQPTERFWVGMPYPGRFVVPDSEVSKVGTSARQYYEGVQVGPKDLGTGAKYRDGGLRGFEIVKPLPVAESRALANPQFGDGGFRQMYIPRDVEDLIEAGYIRPIGHHPLPDDIAARIPPTGRPVPTTPR